MDKKLRVTLQASTPVEGSFGAKRNVLLDFTGDTDLTIDELRGVLAYVVTADGTTLGMATSHHHNVEEAEATHDAAADTGTAPYEVSTGTVTAAPNVTGVYAVATEEPTPTKRRKPRGKTPLICQRCGRPFKGLNRLQKYCHKKDCEAVAAANFIAESVNAQRNNVQRKLNYPKKRAATTPRTPAVCQRCGRPFVAYSKLQKYCGQPDCPTVAAQRLAQAWTPQVTIEAGKGVKAGRV